ncbi:MAG: O-antigen ligase family protein [Alkalinema sp. RU_4_3]|nr:O-antigen ligase family protein [Alkalinema sp. RU_4_3]
MTKLLRWGETIFAIASIFFFSQGLFGLVIDTSNSQNSPDSSSSMLRMIASIIYFVTIALLGLRWQLTCRAILKNKWMVALLALAVASALWSSMPTVVLKKVISLIGTTLFGLYLGTQYSFDRQLKLMGWAFGLAIPLCFLFIFRGDGVMYTEAISGAWKGIYLHKSTLGENMFISFLMFYGLASLYPRRRLLCGVACLLSVILIIFSKSAISLLSLVAIVILLNVLKYSSLRSKLGVSAICFSIVLFLMVQAALIFNISEFLDFNNKDITISGRTPLWDSLWEFVQMKALLGYGYGSFFSASHLETEMLWTVYKWGPVHAHNGYLQILVNLGFVGFSIFILGYFYNLGKALILYLILKDYRTLWMFSFLLYTLVFNFTEVSFMSINHLNWVISVAYIYSLNPGHVMVPLNVIDAVPYGRQLPSHE